MLHFKKFLFFKKFPNFLTALFLIGLWERFSYYGMRALLILFLTSCLNFTDKKAYATYSLFAAIIYIGPLFGGFLADRLMGFYNMILIGSMITAIGHALMVLGTYHPPFIYLSLALIAVGTGFLKGNITNLLGACYKKEDSERERGFTIFYVGLNSGFFITSILCAYLAALLGWHYGFALAGIGIIISLLILIRFKSLLWQYGQPPKPNLIKKKIFALNSFQWIILISFISSIGIAKMLHASEHFASTSILKYFGMITLLILTYIFFIFEKKQRKNLLALSILTLFCMFFLALEIQLGSLINLFIQRNVMKEIFGISIPSAVFQAIHPLAIIVIGSLLGTYLKFDKKYFTFKFGLGILAMALCFLTLYIGCLDANQEGKVHYGYLLTALSFIGIGKLFIGPSIQAQTTILTPSHLRGLMMGMLMLSFAFSKLVGCMISKLLVIPPFQEKLGSLYSLKIYQQGFLKITQFSFVLILVFILLSFILQKIISCDHSLSVSSNTKNQKA